MQHTTRQKYSALLLALLLHALLLFYATQPLRSIELPDDFPEKPATVSFQPMSSFLPPSQPAQPLQDERTTPPTLAPTTKALPQLAEAPASKAEPSMQQRTESPPKNQSSTKPEISGAAFMQAFAQAAYEDHAAKAAFSGPAHVQERVEEWQYAHYREKIAQALIKASRMHRKFIHNPITIKTALPVTLIINEQGIPKPRFHKMTGVDEVDTFLHEFFQVADFPPLPSRFKLKEFPIQITIHLTMAPGGYYLQLRPL